MQFLLLTLDAVQVVEPDAVRVRHGLQISAATRFPPAERDGRIQIRLLRRRRDQGFDSIHQGFEPAKHALEGGFL